MRIPFTTEQFFAIIEKYNMAVFPTQVIILLIGILAVLFIHSKNKSKNKLIGSFLGFLWIWTGVAYHLVYFTEINKAAYVFGLIFILQGILILVETLLRKRLEFEFKGTIMHYVAYFFVVFGLIIYPLLLYFLEGSTQSIISLGLPCPSTIVTFGLLMFSKPILSKYLLIIPVLWTIIGSSAAINFGVYPDYLMAVAALTACIYLLGRKSRVKERMTEVG